jgi:hypothetical protein
MTTRTHSNPALDKLVTDRAPPMEFKPYFKNGRDAMRFFAGAHTRLHSLAAAGAGPCVVCGVEPATNVAACRWDAYFFDGLKFGPLDLLLLFMGRLGVGVKQEVVTFNTFHGLCDRCAKKLRMTRIVANVINFVALFVVVLGGFFAAFAWCGVLYFDRPSERSYWLMAAIVTTPVVVAAIVALRLLSRLRVPPGLRYLASRPFFYHSGKIAAAAG